MSWRRRPAGSRRDRWVFPAAPKGPADQQRDAADRHQGFADRVGRQILIDGQVVETRHRRARAHQRPYRAAIDRELDGGAERRIGVDLLTLDREQDIAVGRVALQEPQRAPAKSLSNNGMS